MTDELITGHPTPELPELRRLIFSIAYRMLGSIAEAEDIVQEAFLRLYHAVPYLVVAVPTCVHARRGYGACALLSCPIPGATAAGGSQLAITRDVKLSSDRSGMRAGLVYNRRVERFPPA